MNIPVLMALATDFRVGLSSCFLTNYEKNCVKSFLHKALAGESLSMSMFGQAQAWCEQVHDFRGESKSNVCPGSLDLRWTSAAWLS